MLNWDTAHQFSKRREFEACMEAAKANGTFVRKTERRVLVRKSTPAAAAVRPRYHFTVFTREKQSA